MVAVQIAPLLAVAVLVHFEAFAMPSLKRPPPFVFCDSWLVFH